MPETPISFTCFRAINWPRQIPPSIPIRLRYRSEILSSIHTISKDIFKPVRCGEKPQALLTELYSWLTPPFYRDFQNQRSWIAFSTCQSLRTPQSIFGNKVDKKEASKEEFRVALGPPFHMSKGKDTNQQNSGGTETIEVFMCNIMKKTVFSNGFDWLSGFLQWTIDGPVIIRR